jgi:hypothetical protein
MAWTAIVHPYRAQWLQMKSEAQEQYAPITKFERQTGCCPIFMATMTLDEASNYFRTEIPEEFADQLALRAERVFARNAKVRRILKTERSRDWLRTYMRHWLAGILCRERPALYRQLPENYKWGGHPLPYPSLPPPKPLLKRTRRTKRFTYRVHGSELLGV